MKLITADEAYNDKDGSILADTGVHLITPVSKTTDLPDNVEPERLAVTCDDFCEIPMIRLGLTEDGHFQRMPVDSNLAKQAIDIRKNIERPFNLLKNREGLGDARVRSQQALTARSTFAMIALPYLSK